MRNNYHKDSSLLCEKDLHSRLKGSTWINAEGESFEPIDVVHEGKTYDAKLSFDGSPNLSVKLQKLLDKSSAQWYVAYRDPTEGPIGKISGDKIMQMLADRHDDVSLHMNKGVWCVVVQSSSLDPL